MLCRSNKFGQSACFKVPKRPALGVLATECAACARRALIARRRVTRCWCLSDSSSASCSGKGGTLTAVLQGLRPCGSTIRSVYSFCGCSYFTFFIHTKSNFILLSYQTYSLTLLIFVKLTSLSAFGHFVHSVLSKALQHFSFDQ